jgi:hypothetical protein
MPKQKLNPDILAAARQGLEAQRERIKAHIASIGSPGREYLAESR